MYWIGCTFDHRPSFTQPPPKKMQKLEGADRPKKSKLSKAGGEGDTSRGKGDAPDHFWSSVEPYFADITEADVQMLQDEINIVSVFPFRCLRFVQSKHYVRAVTAAKSGTSIIWNNFFLFNFQVHRLATTYCALLSITVAA